MYGDVEFPTVDYFCTSIRNDFLREIEFRDNAMKFILRNTVSYLVDSNQENFIKESFDRKITEKNRAIVNYFIKNTSIYCEEIRKIPYLSWKRAEILRNFCDDLVRHKRILKNFPFFNESFINMMMRFSKEEVWGVELSFQYFSNYFSND